MGFIVIPWGHPHLDCLLYNGKAGRYGSLELLQKIFLLQWSLDLFATHLWLMEGQQTTCCHSTWYVSVLSRTSSPGQFAQWKAYIQLLLLLPPLLLIILLRAIGSQSCFWICIFSSSFQTNVSSSIPRCW